MRTTEDIAKVARLLNEIVEETFDPWARSKASEALDNLLGRNGTTTERES